MKWLILCFGVVSNASASILIKFAVTAPRKLPSVNDVWGALTNWPLWLGLVLYLIAFLLYAAALERLPLNVAHPILTSGAIAIVALSSFYVFNETLPWNTIFGIAFILAGVILITFRIS
jgi:small multidrug resistance pump